MKNSQRYPELSVKKYKKKVFYNNLWDSELIESRGKVLYKDGTVVINPFTKIFNYGENNTTIDKNEECLWVEKINGFMASATYVPQLDKVIVATTGSLDSDFVLLAEKYINEKIKKILASPLLKYYTHLFEICDPWDKHIIPEIPGAYLIGMRKVDSTSPYITSVSMEVILDSHAESLGFFRPQYGLAKFGDILEFNKKATNEGVVVYGKSGTVLKLKTPYYLASKAIARSSDIFKLKKQFIDEEFYPLIERLKTIKDFNSLLEEDKLNLIREYYEYK